MNNHSNKNNDDIFHPADDQFQWDGFESEPIKDDEQISDNKNKDSEQEPPIIFNQSAKIFSTLSLRAILILIAIIGNISAVVISSLHKTHSAPVTISSPYTQSTSETEIAEALSWGTSANPAFLSDAAPERFEKTTWPSGNIRSVEPMVNNAIDGIGIYTHDNGKIYGRIPYLHGQKHGRFNLFFEDGNPDQSLSYKNGIPHGVLTWHKTKESWIYVNGKAVKKIPYEPLQ